MYFVRELTIEAGRGEVWKLLRDAIRYMNKKWPSLNAKLLANWGIGSNKAWAVTEHKSMLAYETWNKAWGDDGEVKKWMQDLEQLDKKTGGRGLFTFRDTFFVDTSEEEPK